MFNYATIDQQPPPNSAPLAFRPPYMPVDVATVQWPTDNAWIKASVLDAIRQKPEDFERASTSIQTDPEVFAVAKQSCINKLGARSGDISGFPVCVVDDAEFCDNVIAYWKNSADLSGTDWMKCPDFVKMNPTIARRAVAPIIRALRRDPKIWTQVVSPWREMQELREEAAQNWSTTRSYEDKDPPEDIRELVAELRKA